MFTTTSTYFLMLFLIIWSYCGYIVMLFIFSALNPRGREKDENPACLPKIAIIVPCYNEEDYVKQKIDNLKKLVYEPDKLEVFFLNGLSADNTSGEIIKYISNIPGWKLIETGCEGKINQVNYGLSRLGDDVDIIVSTDMDTVLAPDVLRVIVNEFNSDPRIAVVGANISPQNSMSIEVNYWQDQNLLRIIESNVFTSSIIVAPCYAYKASLIDKFPDDCVADDIFVAFKANTEGYLVKYSEFATGNENRVPDTFSEYFRHKFRKGNAYLIELFRIFYRLPYMSGWWKVIYLTKVLQLAIIPWILPYFLLSTMSLAFSGWGLFQVAIFGIVSIFGSLIVTSFMMKKGRAKYLNISYRQHGKYSALLKVTIGSLILGIFCLSYMFHKQINGFLHSSISQPLSEWGLLEYTLCGITLLFGSLILCFIVVKELKSRDSSDVRYKKRHTLIHFVINNIIMILVGLSYPFYKQTSNYQKVGNK